MKHGSLGSFPRFLLVLLAQLISPLLQAAGPSPDGQARARDAVEQGDSAAAKGLHDECAGPR